jgi:hypothetical protein
MADSTIIEQLDSVKYLYLREISEADKNAFNTLRIIVEEAVDNYGGTVSSTVLERPELQGLLKGAHPIESVEGCKLFQMDWKHYVAYLVTEELVGSNAANGYDDECYEGRLFREYSKSHFLDHISRNTGGHIAELRHYKLICLDHLIDIASYHEPEVTLISAPQVPYRTQ